MNMSAIKPKFIVLEGLDGTGKSTQVKLLQSFFKKQDIDSFFIHFPRTGTESPVFGDLIAKFLRGDFGSNENVHPDLVALLYAGDRYNAATDIQSALEEFKHVIADRYVFSNIAFQCAKLDDIDEKHKLMERIFSMEYDYFKIPKPDMSIFLHVPIEFVEFQLKNERVGEERTYLQGKADIHEQNIEFQNSVEQVYMMACEKYPEALKYINCIDENGKMSSIESIHDKIIKLLQSVL